MADINTFTLTGNLTRDAESTYTTNGYPVLNFSIANNQKKKVNDEWIDDPSYFDCVMFGKYAEAMAPYMNKGTKVAITGRVKQDRWTDNQTGKGRSKVKFNVENVILMSSRGGVNSGPSRGPGGSGSGYAGNAPAAAHGNSNGPQNPSFPSPGQPGNAAGFIDDPPF